MRVGLGSIIMGFHNKVTTPLVLVRDWLTDLGHMIADLGWANIHLNALTMSTRVSPEREIYWVINYSWHCILQLGYWVILLGYYPFYGLVWVLLNLELFLLKYAKYAKTEPKQHDD